MVHLLVVRHETCPGHGEIVHRPRTAPAPAVADTGDAARADAAPVGAESTDEHCLLAAFRRQAATALAPAVAGLPLDFPAVAPVAPAPAARPVAGGLLLAAPKTSPPSPARPV